MTTVRKAPTDHLPSTKKARQRTLWFVTDFDTAEQLEELRSQSGMAGLLGTPSAQKAEQARSAEISKMEVSLRKSSIKVVIQSMSRTAYDKLLTDHPITEAQLEEFKDQRNKPGFNLETYPKALVIACMVEPAASAEELSEWFDSDAWSPGEFTELFTACIQINSQSNVLNLGKG